MSISLRARFLAAVLVPLGGVALGGGCTHEDLGSTHDPLTAVCVEEGTATPPGAWLCEHDATVECDTHDGAYVSSIYVTLGVGASCSDDVLTVSQPGPFLPGTYTIDLGASAGGGPVTGLCASKLVVMDTTPPVVTPHLVALWPPNHRYHHVTPADCVTITDACDAAPRLWFTGASSDEPDDDLGDGSSVGDIAGLGCDGVDLRAERQGTGDGRVYTLGWGPARRGRSTSSPAATRSPAAAPSRSGSARSPRTSG